MRISIFLFILAALSIFPAACDDGNKAKQGEQSADKPTETELRRERNKRREAEKNAEESYKTVEDIRDTAGLWMKTALVLGITCGFLFFCGIMLGSGAKHYAEQQEIHTETADGESGDGEDQ